MNAGGIMKNAPNGIIWAVVLCFVAVVGAFCFMAATGSDSTDLRTFLNTVLNIAAAVFSGSALVVAGSAAKSAGTAVEQTNGSSTEERRKIAELAAETVLTSQRRTALLLQAERDRSVPGRGSQDG